MTYDSFIIRFIVDALDKVANIGSLDLATFREAKWKPVIIIGECIVDIEEDFFFRPIDVPR